MSTAGHIVLHVFDYLPFIIIIGALIYLWYGRETQEDSGGRGVATTARMVPVVAPAAEHRPPAPVVNLPYFPYSQKDRREPEKLVCPICLEVFLHGDKCSEMPACLHMFHTECISIWMKNSSCTCPMCRVKITSGSSVQVSAADNMV